MAKKGKGTSTPTRPAIRLPKKMGGGKGKSVAFLIGLGILAVLLLGIWYLFFFPGKIDYADPEYTWQVRRMDAGDFLVRGKKIDAIKDDPQALIRALNKSGKDPESFRTPKDQEVIGPPQIEAERD